MKSTSINQSHKPSFFLRSPTMIFLLYLLLFNPATVLPQRSAFLRKDALRSSKSLAQKSASLAKLLQGLARTYFEDCTLTVIYDSDFEQIHPVDFHLFFGKIGLPITQETVDFSLGGKAKERKSNKCANYIIFLHNIFAMKHIMAQDVKSKIVIVTAESPWEVKDFLKSPLAKSYMNLLVVTHSTGRKTGYGSYLLYTHKLFSEGGGTTQPQLLASWINNVVTVPRASLFPEKLKGGFMGHRLLVSAVDNPPYLIKRSSATADDQSKWDGLEVRLLRLSASYLNLTVEFTEPRSPGRSLMESAKNDVLLGVTSAAVGGIYQTVEMDYDFDVPTPHTEDCASFISLASVALPKYRAILGPFQPTVWLLLIIAYIILIIPLSFNSNYTIMSMLKHPSNLDHMFWFVFSTYTNSFIVKNPLLDYGIAKNSITILLAIYWIFTIIITSCYTGSIVAFITLPVYPSAMESAKDLLANRYRIGTLDHDGWERWFNRSTTDDPFLKKLFRKIEHVPTVLEGVQNASRAYFWPYAFLASRTSLEYIVQTDFAPEWTTKRTLMHISDECFVRFNVIQVFPAKSLYTKYMNKFVSRATENGLLDKIITDLDWEVQRIATQTKKQITKRMSKKINAEDRVLTVEDMLGMLMLLGIGFILGGISLASEIARNIWLRRHSLFAKDTASAAGHTYWRGDGSLIDSWVVRENRLMDIRHRSTRGSV